MYLDLGEPEQVLLRTHTSPVQIRSMEAAASRRSTSVMPGRAYRLDTPDATPPRRCSTRSRGSSSTAASRFGDLAGTHRGVHEALLRRRASRTRLRPAYFPFTEPSAEFDVTCMFCHGAGCRICSQTGWIELGGCGMVDPDVLRAVGIDPEEWSGFAFGFGIDRMAMMRYGVDRTIKTFFDNDVRFLEQF